MALAARPRQVGGGRAAGRAAVAACVALLAAGCRTLPDASLPAVAAVVAAGAPAGLEAAANRAAPRLALAVCVVGRYPWWYEDLEPWRVSGDAVAAVFAQRLGVAPDRIARGDDLRADGLRQFLAGLGSRFPGPTDLVVYLALHQERDGQVVFGDGRRRDVAEVVDWLNAVPCLRLVILDACYAAVAEARATFRPDLRRWYAADAGRPAYAFPAGYAGRGVREALHGRAARGLLPRGASVAGLGLVEALDEALSGGGRPVTEEDLFARLAAAAQRLRRAGGLSRLPVPVRVGPREPAWRLFDPG